MNKPAVEGKPRAFMGVWTLSLLNVAAVLSIVNFPEQAEYGYQIIFYIAASSIFFFVPTALVSAELASTFPHKGGLFLWGKQAFNPGVGFMTVAMQWFNSLPWYGTVLTFIATTTAYVFEPRLAGNRWFVYLVVVGVMWGCTLVNLHGIRVYAFLSSNGALIGTVIPAVVLVAGAAVFLATGNSPAISFSWAKLLPDFSSPTEWMLLAGMLVALAGIDMTALHVTEVREPRRNFPRAILISSVIIILVSVLGTLAISLVVSPRQLSMASGAGEAFQNMFTALGVPWLTPVVCVLLIIGAITTVNIWILGPSRGLLEVAAEGYLPAFWKKLNPHGVPARILILQATITSLLSLVVLFMPTVGGAFWVFMALSSQLYMAMYILMFAAAWRIRYRYAGLPRPYRVPGGKNWGMIAACLAGMASSLLAMVCGWIPPAQIREKGAAACLGYVLFMFLVIGFFVVAPIWVARREGKLHHAAEGVQATVKR